MMAPSSPPPTPPPPNVPPKDTPPKQGKSKGHQSRGKSISTSIDPVAAASTFQSSSSPYDDVSSPTRTRSRSHSLSYHHDNDYDEGEESSESLEMNTLSSSDDSDAETGLTESARERRKKRKKRRRGFGGISAEGSGKMRDGHRRSFTGRRLSIDRRSVDGGTTKIVNGIAATEQERKEADMNVLRSMAINGIFILMWYTFSLLISIYNKWMFSPDHLNFHFPLFATSCHMIVQFTLSGLVLFAFPSLRPSHAIARQHREAARQRSGSISRRRTSEEDDFAADSPSEDEVERLLTDSPSSRVRSRRSSHAVEKRDGPVMSRTFYLTRIAPCGLATGLDIGLGNMSLRYISLTFYTMCKSSSLAFVLIFAFLFRLEKPTVKLISIIAVMTSGVLMMVFGEVEFKLLGFVLVMTASMLSGLRWSLTQLLLLRNPATGNPFSSIFFLAPVMFAGLIVIALPLEGPVALATRWGELVAERGFFWSVGLLLFPGTIAFCMTASEFALLKRTSVVTLSICGIFKEVLTISAAATVFGDRLTPVNVSGLFVTIASIAAYNYIKIKQMRGDAVRDVVVEHEIEHEIEEEREERRRSHEYIREESGSNGEGSSVVR